MDIDKDINLAAGSPGALWPSEKITPFSTTGGCYRSRIYTSNLNINPLIAACDQILSLVTILKNTEYPENYNKFLQDLAHEIRSFEHHAQIANYPVYTILEARYALCFLLDATVTAAAWQQKISEPKKSLLSIFHPEGDSTKRFFSIIDRALEKPQTNLHLIELMYICLNLGFSNKHLLTKNNQNELTAITNKLYQIITQHNHLNLKNIFIDKPPASPPTHENPPTTPNAINIKKLLGISITIAIIISSIIFFWINLKLNNLSKPICSTIEQPLKNNHR